MTIAQLKLLVDTVQKLSLARELDAIIGVVRTAARKLTGADGASFVLSENNQCYYADEDAISPLWKGQRFSMAICVGGWCMMHKQSVLIEDVYQDNRIPIEAYRPTFVKSMAMVPIRTLEPIGAIGTYWATNHQLTPEEVELLEALANITSVSIENVNVYKELTSQNQTLREIAFLQAHQVRAPIANILGLIEVFNFKDSADPVNAEILARLKSSAEKLDGMIKAIVLKTNEIELRSKVG